MGIGEAGRPVEHDFQSQISVHVILGQDAQCESVSSDSSVL